MPANMLACQKAGKKQIPFGRDSVMLMKAARLHQVGTDFSVDEIAVPQPRPNDVLVKVKACGVIPNMKNVIAHYAEWFPFLPLPPLPAIYGLDAAGEVVAVGDQVREIAVGDRVYVNPGVDRRAKGTPLAG